MNEDKSSSRSMALRFGRNFLSVLTSDLLNKGTTFLVYILVARQLDTHVFGQISLALTLFYTFQVMATFGMQTVITREVAQDEKHIEKHVVNGLVMGLLMSMVSMLLLVGFVLLLNYPTDTRNVILIFGLALMPFSIKTICEATIRGIEKMHLIALVNVPVNLLKVLAVWMLLQQGGNVYQIGLVMVLTHVLAAAGSLAMVSIYLRPWQLIHLDWSHGVSILKRSLTFVGVDTATAWWSSLNIILLSKMTSEHEVGLYNAASQLMIPLTIFIQSIMVAAFPMMCRNVSSMQAGLGQLANRLLRLLMVLAVPSTIGLILIADRALDLIYQQESFSEAGMVVRIMALNLIFTAFTAAMGHVLWASNKETITLRIVIIDLLVNLFVGVFLIHYFGLLGAAVAALVSRLVDLIQHYQPVQQLIDRIDVGPLVWKPLIAGGGMALFLCFSQALNLFLVIAVAMVLYFVLLLAIELLAAGSVVKLIARYL